MTHEQDFLIRSLWRVVKQREAARRYRAKNIEKMREQGRRWVANNREKRREWVANNPDKVREYRRQWYAKNQKKSREFTRRWRAKNTEKVQEQTRRWSAKNPDRKRENNRRSYAKHPEKQQESNHRRRARKRKTIGSFTVMQFKALCQHFKHHCLKCGRPRKLTPDHVIPLSWVGKVEYRDVALNDIDNIQPLCKPCNSGKQHRSTTRR